MNIYKVDRTGDIGYDEYDSFICIAEHEQEAREMHPSGSDKWDEGSWIEKHRMHHLVVTLIGVANEDQQKGILLASFNAS